MLLRVRRLHWAVATNSCYTEIVQNKLKINNFVNDTFFCRCRCCCPHSRRVLVRDNFYCSVSVGILGDLDPIHCHHERRKKKSETHFEQGKNVVHTTHHLKTYFFFFSRFLFNSLSLDIYFYYCRVRGSSPLTTVSFFNWQYNVINLLMTGFV